MSRLAESLGLGKGALICPILELEQTKERHPGVDLLITVGGDGTILRAAHVAAPHGMAILGINMGRVGFMTELHAKEAVEKLGRYLDDDLWVEERAMLQARVLPSVEHETSTKTEKEGPQVCHALNEAVVGSSAVSRMATIGVAIDEEPLTVYRADSVIVATATGSTGYALSAGGPILYPGSRDILVQPVAPYMGFRAPLILPSNSRVQLSVQSDGPASLSVDGFVDMALAEGDQVQVESSPHVARFLRAQPPSHYYATLTQRLGLDQRATTSRA